MDKTAYFTGHRPQDLNGFDPQDNVEIISMGRDSVIDLIENHGVTNFYAGGAIGWDTWMAKVIIGLRRTLYPHIKLILAIPCKGQWEVWKEHNPEDIFEWMRIYEQADKVEYAYNNLYEHWVLPNRNTYMVDRGLYCIACWNGKESGGTWDCLKKSRKKERKIITINPRTMEINKENFNNKGD